MDRVLDLAREMSEASIELDRAALAALVHACADAGSVPHARHFLAKMRELGLAPRPATYLLLLGAMAETEGGVWAEEAVASRAEMAEACTRLTSMQRAEATVVVAEMCIQAGKVRSDATSTE